MRRASVGVPGRAAGWGSIGAVLAMALVVGSGSGCGSGETAAAPRIGPVADFSLTDAHGRAVTKDDLLGKVWVADFVFTRCAGPCPRMTGLMARLYSEISAPNVRFVSISVDPEHDTPEVLEEYAGGYGAANAARWLFLTGDPETTRALIRESFLLSVEKAPPDRVVPGQEVTHSTRFVVVDAAGWVRGYFDLEEDASYQALRTLVVRLAGESAS